MIGWPPGRLGNHPLEPKRHQVQCLNEYVDHSDRVLLRHVVVQELGKQNALPAVLTFDEALHLQLRSSVVEILTQLTFSHSLGPKRTRRPGDARSARFEGRQHSAASASTSRCNGNPAGREPWVRN